MRKFIALGLGALTSTTLLFGSSVAANAVVADPSPTPTQDALCAPTGGLPSAVTDLGTQLTDAGTAFTTAKDNLTAKQAALVGPTANFVTSLVDYVQAIDNNGDVGGALSILNVRISQYASAFADASNAGQAWYDAQVLVLSVQQGQTLFTGLVGSLCPPPA